MGDEYKGEEGRKGMEPKFMRMRAELKELSDEELMLKVQEGSHMSFDILVDRYKVRLYNFILRMVGQPEEAEELAQEAFVKAFIHAGKYKTIARFSTWLYTIATNLVRNQLRARRRMPQVLSLWELGGRREEEPKQADLVADNRSPDNSINDRELSRIIEEAIEKIPEKYRTSFVLREINQLSYEEIAAVTGLKLGTVRSRINRGRNYFRKAVEPLIRSGVDF